MTKTAVLALEDGTVFRGVAIGVDGEASGEVVFNTSMAGYQEMITDPSYSRQILTLTYPHIGNTGVTPEDEESTQIHVAALVIKDLPLLASNWRSQMPLDEYLKSRNMIAMAGIDTRKLTRIIQAKGALNGCIISGATVDESEALDRARQCRGLKGMDLVQEVTTDQSYSWTEGVWNLDTPGHTEITDLPFHVVVYDFGVKRNILRMLAQRGCRLTVVPAQTPAQEVLALDPDGVFFSNGPGDPEPCHYAISAIQAIFKTSLPLFGICLGHQLLALASGAKTEKMKFGHHGANHPVQDLKTGRVMITSQNHSFVVSERSLPKNLKVTHKSLFDGSVQGMERTDRSCFSFQGHPEASPGPHDASAFFDRFVQCIKYAK